MKVLIDLETEGELIKLLTRLEVWAIYNTVSCNDVESVLRDIANVKEALRASPCLTDVAAERAEVLR